tara:strand:- start:25396 stop:25596 length:201 start_codon:yes stop_codon:yes gene_type:complete
MLCWCSNCRDLLAKFCKVIWIDSENFAKLKQLEFLCRSGGIGRHAGFKIHFGFIEIINKNRELRLV